MGSTGSWHPQPPPLSFVSVGRRGGRALVDGTNGGHARGSGPHDHATRRGGELHRSLDANSVSAMGGRHRGVSSFRQDGVVSRHGDVDEGADARTDHFQWHMCGLSRWPSHSWPRSKALWPGPRSLARPCSTGSWPRQTLPSSLTLGWAQRTQQASDGATAQHHRRSLVESLAPRPGTGMATATSSRRRRDCYASRVACARTPSS